MSLLFLFILLLFLDDLFGLLLRLGAIYRVVNVALVDASGTEYDWVKDDKGVEVNEATGVMTRMVIYSSGLVKGFIMGRFDDKGEDVVSGRVIIRGFVPMGNIEKRPK